MKKPEQIKNLSDRQLMEELLNTNYKTESHLRFISNVVSIGLIIGFLSIVFIILK